MLMNALLVGLFLFTRKPSRPGVSRKAPSPSPTTPKRKSARPQLIFESQVPGFQLKVVDKRAVEQVLSEVKFWSGAVFTPKVRARVEEVARVKVVLVDKLPVEDFQRVQALQNPGGEVYQATGVNLEGRDTLVFSIFLAPKFFKTESQERLTLRFLSQFLRTAASFGLEGWEYREFVRSRRLGKILLDDWKEGLPVVVVSSGKRR